MSTIAGWAHYNLLREPGQGFSLRKARCCLKYFGVFFAGKNRIICVIVPRICPRKGNFVTSTDVTIRSAARMKSFVWVLFGRSSAEFQRFFLFYVSCSDRSSSSKDALLSAEEGSVCRKAPLPCEPHRKPDFLNPTTEFSVTGWDKNLPALITNSVGAAYF